MKITATEAQNNFGKYLKLCRRESIIITKKRKTSGNAYKLHSGSG